MKLPFLALLLAGQIVLSQSQAQDAHKHSAHKHHSKYAGQQHREVTSLSSEDIKQLRSGAGWGLAKAAELNGVPGPIHLLELASEISLTSQQTQQIQAIFDRMKAAAMPLGQQLIAQEKHLDQLFRSRSITRSSLRAQLSKIADTHRELRYTHLAAHLETVKVLSADQINRYNKLRGY